MSPVFGQAKSMDPDGRVARFSGDGGPFQLVKWRSAPGLRGMVKPLVTRWLASSLTVRRVRVPLLTGHIAARFSDSLV